MKQQVSKRKIKKNVLLLASLALVFLLTGTFAWVSISQRATNELEVEVDPGGRIHDDFDGENKDIYAENYGTGDVFVRIKLTEYMEINGVPLVTGTSRTNKATWIPNVLGTTSVFSHYVTWTLGGEKVFMPTLNTDSTNLQTDASGIAADDIAVAAGDPPQTAPYGNWTVGDTHPNYVAGGDAPRPAKDTLSPERGGYMTMSAWIGAGSPTGNFWVIDSDGWAYWANKLEASEATSLLLDAINMIVEPDEDWYYGINVIGEFVTSSDLQGFTNMTDNARILVNGIAGIEQYTIALTQTINSATKGDTHQLVATVSEYGVVLPTAAVTWQIVSPHATDTTIDAYGLVDIATDETNTMLIVRATYNGVFNDITFSVVNP